MKQKKKYYCTILKTSYKTERRKLLRVLFNCNEQENALCTKNETTVKILLSKMLSTEYDVATTYIILLYV